MSREDYPAGRPTRLEPVDRGATHPPIPRSVLEVKLSMLEADERLAKYRTASCFSNVPLALHQVSGRAQIDLLRRLLDLPPFQYPINRPE